MIVSNSKESHVILYKYIGKEYLISFCVAFIFFFFIFFINQILLLARKILLSNVDFSSMIHLVILAIPQFLLYTFPFASLSGASMVIGDLTSSNEILAMRSVGLSMKRIYTSIIFISVILSLVTFVVADILMPYSALQYQDLYADLLTKMPALELESNSSTTFGNLVISNDEVSSNEIDNPIIFDTRNNSTSKLISSKKGNLSILDINNFIYSLSLDSPTVMITSKKDKDNWNLAKASKALFFIDFSSQVSSMNSSAPSNLSTVDLLSKINKSKKTLDETILDWKKRNNNFTIQLANKSDSIVTEEVNLPTINSVNEDFYQINNQKKRPFDFYLQYYRAELNKKFALSAACFFLVFMTFPLSYLKFKHGRLIGFALSMLIAVIYWYLLFFAQLQIFNHPFNPLFLMWAPNLILFIISLFLIKIWRN